MPFIGIPLKYLGFEIISGAECGYGQFGVNSRHHDRIAELLCDRDRDLSLVPSRAIEFEAAEDQCERRMGSCEFGRRTEFVRTDDLAKRQVHDPRDVARR